ncbi:DUF6518 family protein [Solirubrobacter phytolaccae]|uniref:DUF6518 family protein n=1 Tax=Solirubrobacter phytolaccae TaxID=1404360 RepID=A0A9X3NEZ1_9ACTN|nr:DUF6518 family protein [Solirubrobacter phytolaccae]MDA0185378.1 DUF6518 family protein [Solirubrobacter phytolaccae]
MHGRFTLPLAALATGLVFGGLGAFGQAQLEGTLEAFPNSISTWLLAPFLVGMLAATRTRAAVAGVATCAVQLAGYYAVNAMQDIGTTASLVVFWTACAVVGGPLFGVAGQLWRSGEPGLKGLGTAALAGVFVAEGAWAFLHEEQRYLAGALWITIGLALAVLSSRGRVEQLRWLGLTVPLGLSGEVVLTSALQRLF